MKSMCVQYKYHCVHAKADQLCYIKSYDLVEAGYIYHQLRVFQLRQLPQVRLSVRIPKFTCSRVSQCANHNKYFYVPKFSFKGKKGSLTYFQLCPPVNTRSKRVEEAMKGEGEVYNDMNDQSENSALPPHTAVVLVVGTEPRLRCTPRQTGATSGH